MNDPKNLYQAYLLRLWRVKQNGLDVWRASLEDVGTGERYGFAGLESLVDFLREQTQPMGKEKFQDEE